MSCSYACQIGKVCVQPFQLQSVADERPFLDLERVKVGGEVDGAEVRAVDERDELERGRPLLSQLGEQIVLDDAGGDDVLDQIDILAADVDVVEEVDLDGVAGQGVGGVADDVDEAVAGVAGDGAQQVAEEAGRPFEHAQEEDRGGAGVLADLGGEL